MRPEAGDMIRRRMQVTWAEALLATGLLAVAALIARLVFG
jgi:hypothetical protein